MKEFCRKRQLRWSGKRWLAVLLSVCLMGTMLPITARAETGETEDSGYEQEEENTSVSENDTADNESEDGEDTPDNESEDEEDTPDNTSEPEDDPAPSDDEEQTKPEEKDEVEDETAIIITSWQWIDEEEYLDPETGSLSLPGANENNPASFDDITAFLPTRILATVENAEAEDTEAEDTEAEDAEAGDGEENITLGDWECDNFPEEGAYSGSYTFAAALPEGYTLSEEAEALEVLVELGGAQTYDSAESETVGAFTVTGGIQGTDYTYADGVLTIKTGKAITIRNTNPATATSDRIEVASGVSANITLAGVNIFSSDAAFKIADNSTGNVTITLADGSENTLISGWECAGLQKNGGTSTGTLTIQGGTNGTGKLTATGEIGAGIGGGYEDSGSNITITGGTVTATGGQYGAGIGGSNAEGSYITISGGTVSATGGYNGAGIGGGNDGDGSDIIISGGTVTATGGESGAGIGGGKDGDGSDITINGGTVTATSNNGPGIGRGIGVATCEDGTIVIKGGSVKADLWSKAADGSGNYVYKLTIANPDGEDVYIDGVSYTPVNHKALDSNDGNLYAYLTGKTHEVKVGEKTCLYMFDSENSTFVATFEIKATNGGTLTYGEDYDYADGALTIKSGKAVTIKNADPSTATTDRIEVAGGVSANITLAGVNIDVSSSTTAAFKIADNSTGNVTITLADSSENTLKSGMNCAGLQKNGSASTGTLTIKGGSNGTGKLTATGGECGAGIGGGNEADGSNITISGGTVTATSEWNGAGIGSGKSHDNQGRYGTSGQKGSKITISGGTVTATSKGDGAGIGGGGGGTGSDIEISGGTVIATGGDGAGIGGGRDGSGSNITIKGGKVTATSEIAGAGIGGGNNGGSGSDIEISGGTVTATSKWDGAGIGGGGNGGSGSNITISGGKVTATSKEGAGIGGGWGGSGSNITISSGKVTATGGEIGAGIGGGGGDNGIGYGSYITISGGTVTATGGKYGAGIGGGNRGGSGSNITISGGTVTATGGEKGAGIGGGFGGTGSDIKISGGSVKASGANAIGSGSNAVTPTSNGTTSVYLLTIENPDNKEVLIDGGLYTPVNHKAVDESDGNLYAYLPAKSWSDPLVVKVGTKETKYIYDNSKWLIVPTVTAPTANELVYTGEDQALVAAGEAIGGTMVYSLTESDTYTENIPTGKNADTYTVWYKVNGDEGYATTLPASVSVTIEKATPVITNADVVTNQNTVYGSDEFVAPATDVAGTFVYQAGENTYNGEKQLKTYLKGVNVSASPVTVDYTFKPTDPTNYEEVTGTISFTIEKATPCIKEAPTAATITYGVTLGDSALSGGTVQYSGSDATTVTGSFAWADSSVKPSVADSGTTTYRIVFTPSDADNYNTVETTVTLTVEKSPNTPNMPSSAMEVPYRCEKVSDVALPKDWVWQEADKDKELPIDTQVTATAVYDGADKGNYVNETVSVSITRPEISNGLWIEKISDQTYNGKAIKPEVWVYYDRQLLTAGKDYTVSYKNNTNAAAADAVNAKGTSIAPTVTVKGKGNFSGTVTQRFTILPINLDNYKTDAQLQEILTIEPVYAKYTGKVIKTAPTVKLNGKKLALSAKQYTCEYNDGNPSPEKEAYKDCGTYTITIVGSDKNFKGKTTVTETISGELISKATITLDRSSYPYDKETGETFPERVTVKYGKNTLTEGTDYTVSYKNYDKIGTATVIITGMGNYSGVKTKDYKITGTKLTTRMITQINKSFPYDGKEHSVVQGTDYKIADGTTGLMEGKDYTVSYKGDRTKAGTFKVTFTGIGAYSGTVTKTFTIQKASVQALDVTLPDGDSVFYTKGGVKPKPEVRFDGVLLTEGTDYTVTYQNNTKAASSEDKKAPCLYITGKGSFTGNTKAAPVKFTISQAPLDAQTIVIDNVPYKNKNNNFVPTITITDSTTGKKLAKKTDYLGSFTYEIWDTATGGFVAFDEKKVEASEDNIRMRVTITAAGSYTGTASVEYEICPKSITSVKVAKIPNREYTGKEITPELTLTDNGKELTEGTDYTLEYSNNINKGTATVTIRGKGQYGGSKTVKFKITSRIFEWL